MNQPGHGAVVLLLWGGYEVPKMLWHDDVSIYQHYAGWIFLAARS